MNPTSILRVSLGLNVLLLLGLALGAKRPEPVRDEIPVATDQLAKRKIGTPIRSLETKLGKLEAELDRRSSGPIEREGWLYIPRESLRSIRVFEPDFSVAKDLIADLGLTDKEAEVQLKVVGTYGAKPTILPSFRQSPARSSP